MAQKNKQSDGFSNKILIGLGCLILVGLVILFNMNGKSNSEVKGVASDAVTTSGDKQIVEVTVRGDYQPGTINAKAGVPTILRMKSDNAYGCGRAFTIPSLNIRKTLPANGDTDIEIVAQPEGTKIKGTCSMGMYSFVINFI